MKIKQIIQEYFFHFKYIENNDKSIYDRSLDYVFLDLKEVTKNNVIDFKDGDLPIFVFEYGLLNL